MWHIKSGQLCTGIHLKFFHSTFKIYMQNWPTWMLYRYISNKNEWRINYHLMDRYAAVAPDLARTIECQSAIWRALSVSRFRGSRFFSCQTLLIQGRDALDLVRPGKGHVSKREDHGGPIKLRYYEKATKFEKISYWFWQNSCFYSVASKHVGDFFQICVAFSEKLDYK